MKTFNIKSQFGLLMCELRNPENVRIILLRSTPALVNKVSMDFNVELIRKNNIWQNGFSMFHTTDSRKEVTEAAKKTILEKCIVIWTNYFEEFPLLQMQSIIEQKKQAISFTEVNIAQLTEEVRSAEIRIANLKALIPKFEQEIRDFKRSFQTKETTA